MITLSCYHDNMITLSYFFFLKTSHTGGPNTNVAEQNHFVADQAKIPTNEVQGKKFKDNT
jgi:hypothetical protein